MMVFSPKSLVSSKEGQTYFRHYFIPNNCNNNKPHALRPGALKFYAALLIIVKLASTSFFFFSYPDQASFASITTANIRNLTNSARIAEGLDPLTENSTLNQAAMAKAKDMVANNYFAHTSPSGTSPWYWFKNAGYIYTFAGENLAMDFIEAEDVVNAWMASPTHRKNIVNTKYEEIGIVSATGSTFILWTDLIETMQKKAASVGGNAIIIIMREKDSEASAFYHPKMGFIGGSSTQKNLTGIVIRIID